ncbi:MAG: PAS domain S-box protein [Pseudomonadota bacterium]
MLEDVFACLSEGLIYQEADGRIRLWNQVAADIFGLTAEQVMGRTSVDYPWNLIYADGSPCPGPEHPSMITLRTGRGLSQEVRGIERPDGSVTWLAINTRPILKPNQDTPQAVVITFADITARKQAEDEQVLTAEVLHLINNASDRRSVLQAVLARLQQWSGCEAVGIRLREGDDYPYFETAGFPAKFVRLENSLCTRGLDGEILRDAQQRPILECMCGNILQGRVDPSKPFFSNGGSFWSSHTSGLLAATTDADRQARTRNRCNGAGYESVALIPLRAGAQTFGLIQLNDKRQGRFSQEKIALLERLANHVAVYLAKVQTEEQLKQSEELYRLLVENANEAILVVQDDRIRYCNRKTAEITGRSAQELASRPVVEFIHPDDRAQAGAGLEKLMSGQPAPLAASYRIVDGRGKVRWLHANSVRITWQGRPAILSFASDVSQHRQAEAEKEKLFGQWQLALQAARMGWWHYDPRSQVSTWDDRYQEIFMVEGYTSANADILTRLHPDDLPRVWAAVEAALDPDDPQPYVATYRINLPGGGQRWVEAHGLAVFEGKGRRRRAVSLVGTVADVTERRQAEEALRISEAELGAIYDNAPIIMILLDEGRRLVKANRAALELGGWREDQAMGLLGGELLQCVNAWGGEHQCGLGPDCQDCLLRRTVAETLTTGLAHYRVETPLRVDRGQGPTDIHVLASTSLLTVEGQRRVLVCAEDVTTRKQAQEALRQSEERFRLAFSTSPDAIAISRLSDGHYLDVNEGFTALTGFARAEVIGRTNAELNIWQSAAEREQLLAELERQGRVTNLEANFRTKGGSAYTGQVSAAAISLGGEPCMITITRDISELKRSQAQLRLWADAFTHCAQGMAIGLPETNTFLAANPAFARMLGRELTDIVGRPILSIYAPNHAVKAEEFIAKVDELGHASYESSMLRADGASFPVQVDLVSVHDQEGQTLYRVASIQDISERRQAQEAILANEKRLHAILAASADPVVVYDSHGLATFVNPAFTRVFGWLPEEVLGQRIPFVPPDQDAVVGEHIAKLYAEGGTVTLETKRQTKDGRVLNIVISAAGIPDDSGQIKGMVVNLTDVSQTKLLEAQLRQAQKMEAIGTLAGGIAHDFNNILGAIMGYTELAQDLAQQGRSNQEELAMSLKAAERARNLVRQILAFSRKSETDARPLSLNKSVRQALQFLERSLPKMIAIEQHLDPDLQLVNADPNQMEQVLLNLATNAADAMPEGGRLIIETKNITLNDSYCDQHLALQPGDYVLLALTDTGQGIPTGLMEHIFDPFFTTKEVGRGTGLGLATVYGIVKTHGGHVYCYSEVGLGTTFKIYLPAYQADQATAPPAKTQPEEALLRGSELILLVDDEPALRELGQRTLESMGYRVLTAASGEQALEVFTAQADQIALVVMDLGMPGMGGHKCLQDIMAIKPEAKVVIASGYSVNGQVKASLEAGAAGFVAKPFHRLDLLGTVRSVLDAKGQAKA